VIPLESLTSTGLVPGGQPLLRRATPDDVPGITLLVNIHARRGDLLPRSQEAIRETLNDWLVVVDGEGVLACGSLLPYTPELAEVRSLAVHDRGKRQGLGTSLVQGLIELARERQVPTLFTLTRAVPFFKGLGFQVTDKEHYPQKVWKDCNICPLQSHCDETAMELEVLAD
jgi:amino-acid N-acetyltransferase